MFNDSFLAKMILDHGQDLMPYLKVRALCELKDATEKILVPPSVATLQELKSMQISGLLKINETREDVVLVTLTEDGRFLGYPKVRATKEPEMTDIAIPYGLQQLVDILGYPVDWESKPVKYKALFYTMLKSQPIEEMLKVARWASKNQKEINLNAFFTKAWYASLHHKMLHRPVIQDRIDSSGYDDPEAQAAAEKELFG